MVSYCSHYTQGILSLQIHAQTWPVFEASLQHRNLSFCNVTFGEKVLTLAISHCDSTYFLAGGLGFFYIDLLKNFWYIQNFLYFEIKPAILFLNKTFNETLFFLKFTVPITHQAFPLCRFMLRLWNRKGLAHFPPVTEGEKQAKSFLFQSLSMNLQR